MYLLGQGVARDDLTGYAWLKVAAEKIFPGYQTIVRELEQAMKPEQRKLADAGAAAKIREYGLAASGVSCQTHVGSFSYRGVQIRYHMQIHMCISILMCIQARAILSAWHASD